MATAARKKASAPEADAMDRGPILDLIADVVPDAERWLSTANSLFGGQAPRDLIGTAIEERVREVVLAYKYGVFS